MNIVVLVLMGYFQFISHCIIFVAGVKQVYHHPAGVYLEGVATGVDHPQHPFKAF